MVKSDLAADIHLERKHPHDMLMSQAAGQGKLAVKQHMSIGGQRETLAKHFDCQMGAGLAKLFVQ